jgi:hypothetical protein
MILKISNEDFDFNHIIQIVNEFALKQIFYTHDYQHSFDLTASRHSSVFLAYLKVVI